MNASEPTIRCPQCKTEIKLTESLAAPLIEATRERYEQMIARKEAEAQAREVFFQKKAAELKQAEASLEARVNAKLQTERTQIAAEEAQKAKNQFGFELQKRATELSELQNVLKQKDHKLAEAQEAQAALMRKERALDDAKREMDLTIEKQVQANLRDVRLKAIQEHEEQSRLKVLEKEHIIQGMQRQIEELKRRAEQGSQQLQGEVLELDLEATFRSKFPVDVIDPVPKGEVGGDFFQRVQGPFGLCGTILWESKRTKNWTDGWLAKLRDDQRAAKAELAVIVSQALPKGVDTFECIDGIWVSSPKCAIPVSMALRQTLIELALARQSREGQQTKMALVYDYLTGPAFRHRINAIVEKFSDMQEDLDKERRAMTKMWAKREAQIRGVIESTAGLYGDLQGIAGKNFQEIEGLDFHLLEERSSEE